MNKDEIIIEIRQKAAKAFPTVAPSRSCLYLAATAVVVLERHGVRAVLQAGTSQWPRIRPEEDDGVCSTHFSYMWEPFSETTLRKIREGLLPEMHCWAAIPETGELVDPSTRYLPSQCLITAGLEWTAPLPPDYLWADELPPAVVYRPDMLAIKLAITLLGLHPEGELKW